MRVLIVVHGFPRSSVGGTEVYAEAHARALLRAGDEVLVFTREADPSAPEYRVREERLDGLTIVRVNNTFRATRSFEETYRNDAIGAIAEQTIDAFTPDVAHVHHLTCLSTTIVRSLARRRIPCVCTLHDYWLMCHRGQLLDRDYRVCDGPGAEACRACVGPAGGVARSSMAAPLVRGVVDRLPDVAAGVVRRAAGRAAAVVGSEAESVRHADARTAHMREVCRDVTQFLAPSRYMRDRFVRFGVPADRIALVDLGVEPDPFAGLQRTSSSTLRLGFVGTLMVSKAPDLLLEAFGRLPRGAATVDLFGPISAYHGDDSYRARLEPLLAKTGVRAHGVVGHEDVVRALASIDVLVVPSIWPENSPLVIREAFLAGVPVVASRIGGIPEVVVHERNGLLFQPGDVEDLARSLQRLLDDPGLLPSLRSGIPAVRSIDDDVRETRELYGRIVRATAGGRAAARVAAVVLNYRTPDETFLAVTSLQASRPPIDMDRDKLVVVNNDDSGGDAVAARLAGVSVSSTGRNLGFSGGMNVGIRAVIDAGATHVLLVNSDVIVPPDCVERLMASLDATPDAGVAGPVVLSRSDPDRVLSAGIDYTASNGRMRQQASGARIGDLDLPASSVVDAVDGCLMLVRREVFDAIGLLDEDYFLGFEEIDFCLRARRAGFSTVLAGGARVHHEGARSSPRGDVQRLYFAARNHLLLARRSDPDARATASMGRSCSIVMLNVAHAVTTSGGSLPSRLAAVARGTRDYVGSRFGAGETEK